MKTKMYSIYDSKLECFGTPFFMPNRGTALRSFMDLANDVRTGINKHPEDYSLFELGDFDDSNGVVEKCQQVNLGVAKVDNGVIDLSKIRELKSNHIEKTEVVS